MMASALIENEMAGRQFPIRSGVFVAVVGPSGAGKDTIIRYAQARTADYGGDVEFVRRVITRPSDPASELHDSISLTAFERAEADGAFAVSWEAHGLRYGLPVHIDALLRSGGVAVANVSRGAVPALRERYLNVVIVNVTASPEKLAERLSERGRETRDEVLARLSRAPVAERELAGATVIENDGVPAAAGERFLGVIRKAVAFAAVSETI